MFLVFFIVYVFFRFFVNKLSMHHEFFIVYILVIMVLNLILQVVISCNSNFAMLWFW